MPNKEEALRLLDVYVKDNYLKHHSFMVGAALLGYARLFDEDEELWYATGLLHDIDFDKYPNEHPGPSIEWFKEWGYPDEVIHAVTAHAYGYNGYEELPKTQLAGTLMACDEISGIFYAYKKLNPIPYSEMKISSIKKRLTERSFAPKIDRRGIYIGCEKMGIEIDEHIGNMATFLEDL
jgi:predicted hydrolase (HD superfamily)